ncbi:uncharacterized protein LOC107364801 isoform X2 [Tetranychus urticae]|uniref:uncharacterized protein LOC107364801 isoform X2 n=1 Tax=Tetranychus urticae TaxID=32264 RepID=UPI00077BA56B|nr:uncharacterized protein LOC107364801 isoform X2 [Tetranychus urticae]
MAFTIYLLAFAVSLVLPSPYHFVLGTSNGINGTSTYNFGYDTRDHPGGSGSGAVDNGPRLMREETRLPDGTVIGRYGYTDPFGVFRQVKYVAGSTGYYAYEDVTGGSGGSTSLPLFFKATARQRDLGLSAGIDLSAKFNPPLYHPEAHLAETPSTTPAPSTLSPWEGSFGASIPFKKILSPSSKPKEEPSFSRSHHHHQPSLYHRDYPSSSNNQLSTSSTSSSSESTPFTLSSSSSKQSRLTHSLSPQSSHNQGRNNERLTLNRDKGLFTTLSASSSTSSSGSVVKETDDGQLRYTRPPKTAFQFDFDQASLIKKHIPDQKSDVYGSYKESNLTPIKSNSNDEDDLKELESFRIPSGLNIHPSSLSRRRSSSSISSSRTSQLNKLSPSQPQSSSTPPPPPSSTTTTVKTPSTYPSTVTTTTSTTTEALINHPIFIRNQVNSEHSNENETVSFDENDRLRRSEDATSSDNNLKNDTYLPTISISREPVLEESSEDDLGETESVRVTSSSSSSSSSSDSNIGDIYNLYSREIKSTSSLAPSPINLSDISRYREATIPEVEILSTYGTRLNNPIDGQLESLGYYDSRLLRGLNYNDFSLQTQPVYTPVIDTSSSTSPTTKSSVLEHSEDLNRTDDKTLGDDSSLESANPLTESVSVAISSTQSSGNEEKDEKLNEKPIESILNLPDQSLTITIKPETTTSMPTTPVSETITETVKPEEPVTFNQADNSYSLLTDQTLKVADGNVKVTPNLTHKQVINNRLITGSTRKSQSVTLSLQTEGTTFSSTSTLPSTVIDKSTVSRLTEVTTEIKALPEIITDEPTTLSPSTLPTTILSSSSSSSLPTTTVSSTIQMRSSGLDDVTTIKPDLGLVGDEVTTPMASVTYSNENNQPTTTSTSKSTIEDSSTTIAESPSSTVENLLTTTEASLLSAELTSKSIQSNWSQSINNDVRPSSTTTFSPSTNDYTASENISGEFPKLPNEPVNNGINHLLSPITKEKDEWLERILIKQNSSQDEPHRVETRLEIPKDSSKPMKKIVKIWYKRGRMFLSKPSTSNVQLNFTNSNEGSDKLHRTKIIRIPRGHRPERMGYRKGVFLNKIPIITTTAATTTTTYSDNSTTIASISTSATDATTTNVPVSTQENEESTTLLSAISTEKALSESPTQSATDEPSTISTLQPTTIISSTPSPSSTSTSATITVITTKGTESPEITNSTQQQPSSSPSLTKMKPISLNNPFLLSTITTTSSPSTFGSIMTAKGSDLTTPVLPIKSTPLPTTTMASTIITSTESATTVLPTTVSLSTSDNNPIKPSALYVPPIASLLRSLVGNQALISKGIGFNSPLGLAPTPRKNTLSSNLYIPPIPAGGGSETNYELSPSSSSLKSNNENEFHYNKHLISSNHNSPITRSVGIINMEKQPYHLPLGYFH